MNLEKINELFITYGLQVVYALLVLLIGLRVIKMIQKPLKKSFERSQIDDAVQKFLYSITEVLLKVILVTIIAGMFGVEMTSFIAVLGAAGFAVGMALQGSLSNFAGGVLILILKPFTVGDFIEAQGYTGVVKEIQIFYTHLLTPDNKLVVIPNGALSNASAVNYSVMDTRRVDLAFGVGYETNMVEVKKTILSVIESQGSVLKDPIPFIRLSEHGDSALVYTVRVWCNAADYWDVYFDLMENVKEAFDKANISIPYPHVEVVMEKE